MGVTPYHPDSSYSTTALSSLSFTYPHPRKTLSTTTETGISDPIKADSTNSTGRSDGGNVVDEMGIDIGTSMLPNNTLILPK